MAARLMAGLAALDAKLDDGTYALVAAMAFLEAGAFVGLVAPGDVASPVGGGAGPSSTAAREARA